MRLDFKSDHRKDHLITEPSKFTILKMMEMISFIYDSFQKEYLILLTILIVVVCIHGGILDQVKVKSEPWPSQKLVIAYRMSYNEHQADQHLSEALVMLPTYKKIRITYDRNLRLEGSSPQYIFATGFVLSETGSSPDDEVSLFMLEIGYKIHKFPPMSHVLSAEHPFRNPLSVQMARRRVYSKIKSYIKKRFLCAHPKMEIYGEYSILFLAPLHRQDDFYVSEAEITPKHMLKGNAKAPNPKGNKPEE